MKKLLAFVIALAMVFALCACGNSNETAQKSTDTGDKFFVLCTDSAGEPIEGAKIQLCTDSGCFMEKSDDNGIAAFDMGPGEYEVHVYKAPEGYTADTSIVNTTAKDSSIEFKFEATGEDATDESVTDAEIGEYSSLDDVNFSDYKLVMVNFWEPWCPHCIDEMPDLEKLYQNYKDKGLMIIGMYSYEEDAEKMIEETGITYPVIKYEKNSIPIAGFPTTYFYTSDGEKILADEEDLTQYHYEYYEELISNYNAGAYDDQGLTEDDVAWFESLIEQLNDGSLIELAREDAKGDIESDPYAYSGSASYEKWEARVQAMMP